MRVTPQPVMWFAAQLLPSLCSHVSTADLVSLWTTLRCCSHPDSREGCAIQSVHGLAALALAVPVFFHWNLQSGDEDRTPAWASTGLDWRGRMQLVAFCIFEVVSSHPDELFDHKSHCESV